MAHQHVQGGFYASGRKRSCGLLLLLEPGDDVGRVIAKMPADAASFRAGLGIAAGTPVAEHIRTGYTAENRPVRLMISIVPGDTLILQYSIPT